MDHDGSHLMQKCDMPRSRFVDVVYITIMQHCTWDLLFFKMIRMLKSPIGQITLSLIFKARFPRYYCSLTIHWDAIPIIASQISLTWIVWVIWPFHHIVNPHLHKGLHFHISIFTMCSWVPHWCDLELPCIFPSLLV